MKNDAGSAHQADPAFLCRNSCGQQRVAMPIAACRLCGRTSHVAVARAENNLSLMPTGSCRGTVWVVGLFTLQAGSIGYHYNAFVDVHCPR